MGVRRNQWVTCCRWVYRRRREENVLSLRQHLGVFNAEFLRHIRSQGECTVPKKKKKTSKWTKREKTSQWTVSWTVLAYFYFPATIWSTIWFFEMSVDLKLYSTQKITSKDVVFSGWKSLGSTDMQKIPIVLKGSSRRQSTPSMTIWRFDGNVAVGRHWYHVEFRLLRSWPYHCRLCYVRPWPFTDSCEG